MSPILDSQTVDFVSGSDVQTRRLGERLAALLAGGDVVCMSGDLGSGKTCFVQGIAKGLGVRDIVVSPTFTIIREYSGLEGRPRLFHVDLYRLREEDIPSTGLEDYLDAQGLVVIEWADHLGASAPAECLRVELRYLDETKRGLRLTAHGARYESVLEKYKRALFGA